MKRKKILVAFVMSAIMVMGSVPTFATEGGTTAENDVGESNNICGEIVLTEEEYEEYLAGLSEYDLQRRAEKEAAAKYETPVLTRVIEEVSIPGTFTMYQQETENYCVPATIKSILMYINGSSPSQSEIWSAVQGHPEDMPAYLNARQDQCYYMFVPKSALTLRGMCARLYATITETKSPASMGIAGTTEKNWYYATPGHSLVVNAMYNDYTKIQFGDPLGELVTDCPYFYYKGSSFVHQFCTRIVF